MHMQTTFPQFLVFNKVGTPDHERQETKTKSAAQSSVHTLISDAKPSLDLS